MPAVWEVVLLSPMPGHGAMGHTSVPEPWHCHQLHVSGLALLWAASAIAAQR